MASKIYKNTLRWFPLLLLIVKRDFFKQFKGSYIGLGWMIIVPILYLIIYTFVFTEIFNVRWGNAEDVNGKINFALFLFCGLTIFNFYSTIISSGCNQLISQRSTIIKIAFPVIVLPIGLTLNSLIATIVPIILIALLSIIYVDGFSFNFIYALLLSFPMFLSGLSIVLIVSATSIFFRDTIQIARVFVTFLMFISPVFYPSTSIPEKYISLFYINPLVIPIKSLRSIFLGTEPPSVNSIIIYCFISLIFLLLSLIYFLRLKRGFADSL